MVFTPSTTLHVLNLMGAHLPLLQVLRIEEALLRADSRNWLVLYPGPPTPTIVLGISGRVERLVHVGAARAAGARALRRFTGGGTVVADAGTVFVSLCMGRGSAAGHPQFPREIMAWSREFYEPVFRHLLRPSVHSFSIEENDYCAGDLKFGGNAQAVSRDRWVHHTSFLWSICPAHMGLLKVPEKRPAYRRDRPHEEFLTCLADLCPPGATPASLPQALLAHLQGQAPHLALVHASLEEALLALPKNERCSNEVVDL